jgi:hypothetical protein
MRKLMVSVFFPCWSWSCLFHCLLDKTLFPSGTQPGISSQVRTMENDKVVSINLAYDFKCWRMSFQSSVSDSFNQYFVHEQLEDPLSYAVFPAPKLRPKPPSPPRRPPSPPLSEVAGRRLRWSSRVGTTFTLEDNKHRQPCSAPPTALELARRHGQSELALERPRRRPCARASGTEKARRRCESIWFSVCSFRRPSSEPPPSASIWFSVRSFRRRSSEPPPSSVAAGPGAQLLDPVAALALCCELQLDLLSGGVDVLNALLGAASRCWSVAADLLCYSRCCCRSIWPALFPLRVLFSCWNRTLGLLI